MVANPEQTNVINDAVVRRMASGLREFGYPEVTDDEVKEIVTNLVAGRKPKDVLGLFIQGWLSDAELLP